MKINIDVKQYSEYKTWKEFFPTNKINLRKIKYHASWIDIFEKIFADKRIENIEKNLSKELEINDNVIMHPAPELLFNAFLLTKYDKISVVFIGQDPYFDHIKYNNKNVHQAMGLSFSVPYDMDIPSSLSNVYKNMIKNKVLKDKPKHGNLEFWALQGCLMLNSSLTVLDGSDNKNCHQNMWKWFTDEIIKYISKNKDNVVFVLWGNDAYSKINLIDLDKHEVIVSSHPSGLSCNKKLREHPSFDEYDHFNTINKYLIKFKKNPIVW